MKPGAVGHNNVFPLTDDMEPGFLEGFHRLKVIDTRKLGHASGGDFYFANLILLEGFLNCCEVFLNSNSDIIKSFFLGIAL